MTNNDAGNADILIQAMIYNDTSNKQQWND